MTLTKASMGGEDRGGKPNPGTPKDKRLTKNKGGGKRGWEQELVDKSGSVPLKNGPVIPK